LREQAVSLAFSTYRANRLLFLGVDEQPNPSLKLHERLFDRPMGLFVAGESIWMAARCQLWRLDNLLGPGQLHEGGDRLYVPAASYTTGDVNAHELVLGPDGQPIFVNTAFSCLAGIAPGCSFAPTWAPPFISELAGDDRCHLNGIALKEGVPAWATACGGNGDPSAWRNERNGGGVLIHIPSGELAARGLSMPHSPRWHGGKLWLLNSSPSPPCPVLPGAWPLWAAAPWWGSPNCARPSSPACRWRNASPRGPTPAVAAACG
jgi:uncharacterized protein (TIGR03032 family)